MLVLFANLKRHGATIRVDGDKVIVKGRKPVLTQEVVAALRQHKLEIVDYLSMPLDRYLAMLGTAEVLSGDELPPVPPRSITESGEGRAEAWAAWWDAVEKQQRVKRTKGLGHE